MGGAGLVPPGPLDLVADGLTSVLCCVLCSIATLPIPDNESNDTGPAGRPVRDVRNEQEETAGWGGFGEKIIIYSFWGGF